VVGDRFCLLPHAASLVDPLFSSGLGVTMNAVNGMAHRLLAAMRDDDFSAERFEHVDTWVQRSFAYYDTLVSSSYKAFADYEVWNAWHRIWMIGSLYGLTGQFDMLSTFERTGDPSVFDLLEQQPYRGVQTIDLPAYAQLFEDAARAVAAFHEGARSARETSEEIYANIRRSGLAPAPWSLEDAANRCPAGTFTAWPIIRLVAWGRYQSPEAVRRHYFRGGRGRGLLSGVLRAGYEELGRMTNATGAVFRDALLSWNDDWRAGPAPR
jgi:FADH2 O2-dependent halogenase